MDKLVYTLLGVIGFVGVILIIYNQNPQLLNKFHESKKERVEYLELENSNEFTSKNYSEFTSSFPRENVPLEERMNWFITDVRYINFGDHNLPRGTVTINCIVCLNDTVVLFKEYGTDDLVFKALVPKGTAKELPVLVGLYKIQYAIGDGNWHGPQKLWSNTKFYELEMAYDIVKGDKITLDFNVIHHQHLTKPITEKMFKNGKYFELKDVVKSQV